MQYKKKIDVNPFNSIGSILTLVLIFVALYFIATSIFKLLTWAAPFLLIGALILNHKVVLGYGKWILKLIPENPVMGIGAVLLTIFGFPIIAGFLFGKAWLYRKVDKMRADMETQTKGEYIEYEEVNDVEYEEIEDIEPKLELPRMQQQKRDRGNEYEQLFDD